MTTPLPTELTYGTVRWTVVGIAEDEEDPGSLPDAEQINGKVTFRAAVPSIKAVGGPQPVTVLPRPVVYPLVNGRLQDTSGNTDIRLVANDSPGTSPRGWNYEVTYELDDGFTFGSFFFDLSTDEVVDLTTAFPQADPETGILYVQGPPGNSNPLLVIAPTRPTSPQPGTVYINNSTT